MQKAILLLTPLTLLTLLPTQASAQVALEGEVYAESDGWRVSVEPLGCILANRPATGSPEIWVLRTDYGVTDFSFRLPAALPRDEWDAQVSMRIGDVREELDVTYAGQRLLLTRAPTDELIAAFRNGEVLEIHAGERQVGQIALAESENGFTDLLECAAALPQTDGAPPRSPGS